MNKIKLLVFGLLVGMIYFVSPTYSRGAVLFQDNFDSHDDWSPTQTTSSIECGVGCGTAPDGYAGWRMQGSFFDPPGNNTLNLNSNNYRGSSGKALTFWDESGSNYASDGLLYILLNSDGYEELYVRFFIKFQPGWQWSTTSSSMHKFFRISHYHGGNPFQMVANNHPMMIAQLVKWNSGSANIDFHPSYRYENVYYPDGATPPHSRADDFYFGDGKYSGTGTDFWDDSKKYPPYGMTGDGNWHSWEFYVKINSDVGVPDGIFRFWQDGILIAEETDLAWGDEGSQANPRKLWNCVMIGGNNLNRFSDVTQKAEQWYAIDDLVISTEYIGRVPNVPTNLRIVQ